MTRSAGSRTVVAISGEIDIDTEQMMHHALRLALARSSEGVDLDLAGVGFCDCAGLNVLIRVRRLALADGKTLCIRALSPEVERLFTLTDTSSMFSRVPSNGVVNAWNPHSATTHDFLEENRVPNDAEELRVEAVQLKRAMLTRPIIDLARGILMASYSLGPEDAWSVLVDASQHTNTKLHQLAEQLVGSVTGPPLSDQVQRQISRAVAQLSPPEAQDTCAPPRSGALHKADDPQP
ncbi:ANTAR domain-containing protein [Streptomyces sp. NPDC096013]|uniref:ANTAR domain-containing protein n=1 Tax=Streptomyces sp. NPDC096013 TaxID=3366069 RepID=UPI00380B82BC